MDYVTSLELMMKDGVDSLWRTVRAMPDDKLDWRPEETARTTRELLEEIVTTLPWNMDFVKTQKAPEWHDSSTDKKMTLEELEKTHRDYVTKFMAVVKEFPEKDLQKSNELPWGKMTFFDVIMYPYWNMIYHWGQISYLQTMYGDKEMH